MSFGTLGLGLSLGVLSGSSASLQITVSGATPAGQLFAGEDAAGDLTGFATFAATSNYASAADGGAATISSVAYQINGADAADDAALSFGDVPSFLVTDSEGNARSFGISPVVVFPAVSGTIPDQTFERNTDLPYRIELSSYFVGTDITYFLTTGPGFEEIYIGGSELLLEVDDFPVQTGATIGVTAQSTYGTSAESTFLLTTTDAPGQMAAPSLAVDSNTQITVTRGTAPNDNNSAITSYSLERSLDGATWTVLTTNFGATYVDTGLTAGTGYRYRQWAVNAVDEGARSPESQATTTSGVAAVIDTVQRDDTNESLAFDTSEGGTLYGAWHLTGDTLTGSEIVAGTDPDILLAVSDTIGATGATVFYPAITSAVGATGDTRAFSFVVDNGSALSAVETVEFTLDLTPPALSTAVTSADGTTITLTFDGALLSANPALLTDWTVEVDSVEATISSQQITPGDLSVVEIVLASAVANGDVVEVSYAGNGLRDAHRNEVAAFTGQAVTNNVPAPSSRTVVVPLWGQSQVVGRAVSDGATEFPTNVFQVARTGSLSGGTDGQVVVVPRTPTVSRQLDHHDPGTDEFGPELTFAIDWIAANPSDTIVFVPCAKGGTGFAGGEWRPAGDLYTDLVSRVNTLMTANPDYVLGPVLGALGGNDATAENDDFQADLQTFIDDFRTDITVANSSTVFLLGGMADTRAASGGIQPYGTDIQNVFKAADELFGPYVTYWSGEGLNAPDGKHFDAASMLTFGERAFTAYATGVANITRTPSAVDELSAASGDVGVTLSWTAPFDGHSDLIGYDLERQAGGSGSFLSVATVGAAAVSYLHTSGSAGDVYRITAENGFGAGASATATASLPAYVPNLVSVGSAELDAATDLGADAANNLWFFSGIFDGTGRTILFDHDGTAGRIGRWSNDGVFIDLSGASGGTHSTNEDTTLTWGDEDSFDILIATEESGGNILTTAYGRVNSGAWTACFSDTITGQTTVNLTGGAVKLFDETTGTRQFGGSVRRVACWTGLASPVDLTSSTVRDMFVVPSTGVIERPSVSQATYGIPKVDFNGDAAAYNAGTHDGSLTFTASGTFS